MNNLEHMAWHTERQRDMLLPSRRGGGKSVSYRNSRFATKGERYSGNLQWGRQALIALASGIHRIARYLEHLAGYSRELTSNGCADGAAPCIH